MKNNKKITWILSVLVVSIWGTITYQVFETAHASDAADREAQLPVALTKQRNVEKYRYVADVRDPFVSLSRAQKDTTRKAALAKLKIVWSPPPLKLTGILMANKRKTAMVEGTNGSVFFLQEGDTLNGMKVLKITDRNVRYVYQKQKAEWVLEGP